MALKISTLRVRCRLSVDCASRVVAAVCGFDNAAQPQSTENRQRARSAQFP
jgi:hypothetical protein